MRKEISYFIEYYRKQGFCLIPLKGKTPIIKDWLETNLSDEDIKNYVEENYNIGVLLGEKSNWLVDVDIDDPDALECLHRFLPLDTLKFGRETKPVSHILFRSKDCKSMMFKFPSFGCIIEIRSTGQQTMFPPSLHPNGERLEFLSDLIEPKEISAKELYTAVSKTASATLLAKYWAKGIRQDFALALSGGLLRAGWGVEKIINFVEAICDITKDEEREKRIEAVKYTAEKFKNQEAVTGWTKLKELIGKDVVEKVINWLNINSKEEASNLIGALDLMQSDLPPISFIVDDILPQNGLSLLVGDEKIGKSWLILQLAIAISQGKQILGKNTEKQKVLYFALEDGDRRIKDRLEKLQHKGFNITNDLLIVTSISSLQDFEQKIITGQPSFVIIDTLKSFRLKTGIDNNTKNKLIYDIDYEAGNIILDIAKRFDIHILAVHHTKKQESIDVVKDSIGRITTVADAILILKRKRNEIEGKLLITGRDIAEQELELFFEDGIWNYKGDAQYNSFSDIKKKILEITKDNPLNYKEIAKALGEKETYVKVTLSRMRKAGLLQKIDKGIYITSSSEKYF